ncbi:hypothetical protein [Bacillus thermotolerans]|uniref:DUF1450 domain-containing protein n=1 Tax=Bacillus thermotolerans TaxID=1221996 RepID=A0A0F5I8B7_BACTR|nr:hypothetical protein [Bacillus thermotolerans]KKB33616.1 hypothetical protein QY97_03122 [Bacillus thermotolerans]KKB41766.1 hypothetical protein QY95_00573 [Bacillus thermotolerans]KKB44342.1 hypothetical protein QY96_02942 [Bacillus thermotolerans]
MNEVMYCHKNKVKDCEPAIRRCLEEQEMKVEFLPIFCMKICIACPHRYILDLNRSLIIAADEEDLLAQVKEKAEEEECFL